jgi:hypothetical protein
MKRTICLDFDGVCNTYDGWRGEEELFQPRAHLGDFISSLIAQGKRVVIFSTRPPIMLEGWFAIHFPAMGHAILAGDLFFPSHKPPADCYVDDRAVRFNGSFEDILPQVLNFKAYWEKMTFNEALANAGKDDVVTVEPDGTVSISQGAN